MALPSPRRLRTRVGFIGTGQVAEELGLRVMIGSQQITRAQALAAQIGAEHSRLLGVMAMEAGNAGSGYQTRSDPYGRKYAVGDANANVLLKCDLVIFAVSSGELSALLEKHRTDLAGKGKVLINTSNPYSAAYWGSKHELPPDPYLSAVQHHADVLGDTSTAWASGFKCLIPPDLGHQRITEVCGDLRAKTLLSSLVEVLGWNMLDCGSLDAAPRLEPRGPAREKHARIIAFEKELAAQEKLFPEDWRDSTYTAEQAAAIESMRRSKTSLQAWMESSVTTLESTSALLWEQFHTIPRSTLQAHIILRFNMFDLDNSGCLDISEMRKVMALLGKKLSDGELGELVMEADSDVDGRVSLEELSLFIFRQLGVADTERSKELRDAESSKKSFFRALAAQVEPPKHAGSPTKYCRARRLAVGDAFTSPLSLSESRQLLRIAASNKAGRAGGVHSGIKDVKRRSQPSVTVQASMKTEPISKRALSAGPCLAGRKSRMAQSNHAQKSDLQTMNPDAGSRKRDGIRVAAQQTDTPDTALREKFTTRQTSPDRDAIAFAKTPGLDGSCTKKEPTISKLGLRSSLQEDLGAFKSKACHCAFPDASPGQPVIISHHSPQTLSSDFSQAALDCKDSIAATGLKEALTRQDIQTRECDKLEFVASQKMLARQKGRLRAMERAAAREAAKREREERENANKEQDYIPAKGWETYRGTTLSPREREREREQFVYEGKKDGYVFKEGVRGLGYYRMFRI